MVNAKTTSRNVPFKAYRMDELLLAAQAVLTHEVPDLSVSLDDEEILEDLGHKADIYILNRIMRWIRHMFHSVHS